MIRKIDVVVVDSSFLHKGIKNVLSVKTRRETMRFKSLCT
jgi:hypothetical protein